MNVHNAWKIWEKKRKSCSNSTIVWRIRVESISNLGKSEIQIRKKNRLTEWRRKSIVNSDFPTRQFQLLSKPNKFRTYDRNKKNCILDTYTEYDVYFNRWIEFCSFCDDDSILTYCISFDPRKSTLESILQSVSPICAITE